MPPPLCGLSLSLIRTTLIQILVSRLQAGGGGLSDSGQRLSAAAQRAGPHASGSATNVRKPVAMKPKAKANVSNLLAMIFTP